MDITATELKNRLGQYIDSSIKEPVTIERNGRKISVLMSYDDYKYYQEIEEKLLAMKALEAKRAGFEENPLDILKSLADEKGVSIPELKEI